MSIHVFREHVTRFSNIKSITLHTLKLGNRLPTPMYKVHCFLHWRNWSDALETYE